MIFLVTSILKPLQMIKSCLIFDHAAKLSKASRDIYDPGLLLIFKDIFENWVAEGDASDCCLLRQFPSYNRICELRCNREKLEVLVSSVVQ